MIPMIHNHICSQLFIMIFCRASNACSLTSRFSLSFASTITPSFPPSVYSTLFPNGQCLLNSPRSKQATALVRSCLELSSQMIYLTNWNYQVQKLRTCSFQNFSLCTELQSSLRALSSFLYLSREERTLMFFSRSSEMASMDLRSSSSLRKPLHRLSIIFIIPLSTIVSMQFIYPLRFSKILNDIRTSFSFCILLHCSTSSSTISCCGLQRYSLVSGRKLSSQIEVSSAQLSCVSAAALLAIQVILVIFQEAKQLAAILECLMRLLRLMRKTQSLMRFQKWIVMSVLQKPSDSVISRPSPQYIEQMFALDSRSYSARFQLSMIDFRAVRTYFSYTLTLLLNSRATFLL